MTTKVSTHLDQLQKAKVATVLGLLGIGNRPVGYRSNHLSALAGTHFYAVGSRLALDLGAPRIRVIDVIDRTNYVAPEQAASRSRLAALPA